ncbi:MAG: hypothetical protein Q7T08_02720, partial [Devosia sp.]|nr:hypothetical protein [Devosia sp.]
MTTIIVSDETKHLIDTQALRGYTIRQTATRLPDGRWTLPGDDEVFEHIGAARLPGETDDDVASRL